MTKEFTIIGYTAKELQDKDILAFNHAHCHFMEYADIEIHNEEFRATLKAFEETFNVTVHNWCVDSNTYDFTLRTGQIDDEVLALSGVRLLKWLFNNHWQHLSTPKGYYGKGCKKHTSKIFRVTGECPFTGVCYDEDILDEIHAFMRRPYDRTLEDLLRDCVSVFFQTWRQEMEYRESEEAFIEDAEANEWFFDASGDLITA